MRKRKLLDLCESWERQAGKRFYAARYEKTELGKACLENGAMIHANVASELRDAMKPKFRAHLLFKKFFEYIKRPGRSWF